MRSSGLRSLLLACFLPLLYIPGAMGEQTWTEVRSPHFRVITDGSAKDARTVADEFEQMRAAFAMRFKNDQIQSGPPLTIVAARDWTTFHSLLPPSTKLDDSIAGMFFRNWEKQFAIIRLDASGDANQTVVYHEYTHSVLHANAHWLPLWLDEGFAEFYAYTRFEKNRTYIGAPSLRLGQLRNRRLIPVSTMLDANNRSPSLRGEIMQQLFYAEAWAMVHYMTFGPGMGNGEKFNKFFAMLQNGTDQQTAFHEVFGDPAAFDSSLLLYVNRFGFTAAELPASQVVDQKSLAEHKLTPAETTYELACLHIGFHDFAGGRTLLEKSLALEPKRAAAHEELGFVDFDEGKDSDSEKEWRRAVALDPSLARSLFALTMTGPLSGNLTQRSHQELRAAQATLQHVTQLDPKFAPAYVELALVEWQIGILQQAYSDAQHAEALEPWRAGYHLLTGHILLHGNQPLIAVSSARYVAKHWFGSDHDEAVDLWQAVPAKMRGDGPPLTLDVPAGAVAVRGKLTEISCDASKEKITLQPDKPGSTLLTFTTEGRSVIGFSDTLWWGEDHFSCHHLAGYKAIVVYKPDTVKGPQVIELEIRDNLPDDADAVSSPQNSASAK